MTSAEADLTAKRPVSHAMSSDDLKKTPPGLGTAAPVTPQQHRPHAARKFSAREVYSLLVFHGLKPELAAPFLDHGITSNVLRQGVEKFPDDFPTGIMTEDLKQIIQKIWSSTPAEIRASAVALDSLPVCVVDSSNPEVLSSTGAAISQLLELCVCVCVCSCVCVFVSPYLLSQ